MIDRKREEELRRLMMMMMIGGLREWIGEEMMPSMNIVAMMMTKPKKGRR